MADSKESKSLEMRIAELEDKLSKVHITEDEMKAYHKVSSLMGSGAAASSPCVAAKPGVSSSCVAHSCVTACVVHQSCVVRACILHCVVQQCVNCIAQCINECNASGQGGGGVGGGGFGTLGS
jgi:hypothetical protein